MATNFIMKAIILCFRMRSGFCAIVCRVLGALLAGIAVVPVSAATITRIIWTSHNGTYINDTIVNGTTSPLAFTATNDLAQPFLNATDSTIALNYGTYYVISFRGYGAHTGSGTISFLLDGVTKYSQNVIFPDPTLPSGVFAAFALPGGDRLTISATGFSADRIRIIADGAGLAGDGVPDAFYKFDYTCSSLPTLTILPAVPGYATISWSPATAGFVLQEGLNSWPAAWTNSISGPTNPIVIPTPLAQQSFRLIKP